MPLGVPGRAVGDAYLFEPEGLRFDKPARLTIAIADPEAERIFIATAPKRSSTFALLNATHNQTSTATAISHFSYFVPVALEADGGSR